ncbi:hypothetical protein Thini_4522 [Thiothrix nivea DSM 5205]|uniref:Uncharacterized protein n=1 Tax=Thiothrix nivea (strain ATCC 35100 / DSM 5205 / JP2) TaxID=870187 RepID=A0A656HL21_THINJ|nr:hypothetical protein Thini_4522 [Thiothrix nivea DSM 5205]
MNHNNSFIINISTIICIKNRIIIKTRKKLGT